MLASAALLAFILSVVALAHSGVVAGSCEEEKVYEIFTGMIRGLRRNCLDSHCQVCRHAYCTHVLHSQNQPRMTIAL